MGRSPIEMLIDRACGNDGRPIAQAPPKPREPISVCVYCQKRRPTKRRNLPKGTEVLLRGCKKCDPEHRVEETYHRADGSFVK